MASFLVTCVFTLWATLGQLATSYLLFRELRTSASLPAFATGLLLGVAIGAAALLVVYGTRSIKRALDEQEQMFHALGGVQPGWSLL